MQKISEAMILCAGLGTRMRPLTDNLPKPLIPVLNKPILDYLIESLTNYGVTKIVINKHYFPEQIEERVNIYKNKYPNTNFITIFEPELLDSGGGVKNASKHFLGSSIFVINGDIIFLNDKAETLSLMNEAYNNEDCLMAAQLPENAIGYDGKGDFVLEDGKIVRFAHKTNPNSKPYIFPGIQIIKLDALNRINESIFSLRELYYTNFTTQATVLPNKWLHIGTPQNLKDAEKYLSSLLQ
ncbi:MAG: nucleotidyltransferase family protein [Alphaproteobacteria bacterium]|nr:nucleotidyltransferase family protein [Alphaproteobacteria bacterium]OJV15131.1 MAG: hypothetical protein BGO27_06815 [Alphaproteobacteria bacterium 33-17]